MKRTDHLRTAGYAVLLLILSAGCGKVPSGLPDIQTGDLMITARDTSVTDSMFVQLDYDPAIFRENPCFIGDVVAGFHRLYVFTEAAPGSVFSALEVTHQETTFVEFTLNTGPVPGAFVGNIAPDFLVQDVNGGAVRLSDLQPDVVLLLFIEYT
ncbi:hypothetical protein JXO52_06050 [bacterium]|nr:hypothetical protein [bacterium]